MRTLTAVLLCLLVIGCGGEQRPLASNPDGTVRCTFAPEDVKEVCLTDFYRKDPKPVAPERRRAFYDAVNGAKEIPMGARLAFEPDKAVLFRLADGREVLFYGGSEGGRQWGVIWRDNRLSMMIDSPALGDARRSP